MASQELSAPAGDVRRERSISVSSDDDDDDDNQRPQPFHKIGQGSFGAIFAHPVIPVVYKREINSASNWWWSIEGEYAMHQLISAAFDKWSPEERGNGTNLHVQVPSPHVLILADSPNWWAQCSSRFSLGEPDYLEPSPTLQAERIPSLPQVVRHDLIDKFCTSGSVRVSMKRDTDNDICLLRLYLGRRARSWKSSSDSDFQIHNFPCHVDQMKTLGLDTHYIAAQLGRALAVLHFEARVDGRDVEFVLGAARHVPEKLAGEPREGTSLIDESSRVHQKRAKVTVAYEGATIWCLDFNQCQPVSFAADPPGSSITVSPEQSSATTTSTTCVDSGTIKCIAAYFANDPYFPRPHQPELWATFSRTYEDMAGQIGAAAEAASRPQKCYACYASWTQSNRTAAADVDGALGQDRAQSLARAFIQGVEEIFSRAQVKRRFDEA